MTNISNMSYSLYTLISTVVLLMALNHRKNNA